MARSTAPGIDTGARTHAGRHGAPSDTSAARYAAISLEGIVALAALGGGVSMVLDPAGAMGLPPEMLDRLPVDSWLAPGLALIACNALLPTACAVAELRGREWPSRFGHFLAGTVLLAWPVTETVIFGYPLHGEPLWLRPVVAITGLVIMGLGLQLRGRARTRQVLIT